MIADEKRQVILAQVDGADNTSNGEIVKVVNELQSQCRTIGEENDEMMEEVWDDESGVFI